VRVATRLFPNYGSGIGFICLRIVITINKLILGPRSTQYSIIFNNFNDFYHVNERNNHDAPAELVKCRRKSPSFGRDFLSFFTKQIASVLMEVDERNPSANSPFVELHATSS